MSKGHAVGSYRRAVVPKRSRYPFRVSRLLLIGAVCTTLTASMLTIGVASATPRGSIGTLRDRVNHLENQLANEEQISQALSQHYDEVQGRLVMLDAKLATTEQHVHATIRSVKSTRRELQGDAILAYVFSSNDDHSLSLFNESANESEASSVYQRAAIGDVAATEAHYEVESLALLADQRNLRSQRHDITLALHTSNLLIDQNHRLAVETSQLVHSMGKQLRHLVLEAAIAAARAAAEQANEEAAAAGAAGVAGQLGGGTGTIDALRGFSGSINGSATGNAPGMAAFAAAKTQIGVPYVWGGESPGSGFDCSGLTQWAWAQAGVSIPRTAAEQYDALPHVSLGALQPGDLLFYFNLDGDDSVDHVVMYGGSGPWGTQTTIAADYTGTTIQLQPAFTYGLIGAARP
jgi:peptidoglycan DL-endopeptidase CwlO